MKLWHFVRSGRLQRDSFDIALTALDDAGVPYVMRECASVAAAWMLNLAARVKRAHDRVSDQYSEAGDDSIKHEVMELSTGCLFRRAGRRC